MMDGSFWGIYHDVSVLPFTITHTLYRQSVLILRTKVIILSAKHLHFHVPAMNNSEDYLFLYVHLLELNTL